MYLKVIVDFRLFLFEKVAYHETAFVLMFYFEYIKDVLFEVKFMWESIIANGCPLPVKVHHSIRGHHHNKKY